MTDVVVGHTPGPWQWEQLPSGRWVLTGGPPPTPVILTVDKDEFGPLTDPQANARLITVAPEMYDALVAIQNHVPLKDSPLGKHDCGDCRMCFAIAEQVIAKAEGRES